MPYATVAHVKARAGFLSDAWGEETKPSTTDVAGFLADVSGEIDAAIEGLGFSPPEEGSVPATALRGLNADGALLLALDATFPAGEGPAAATALQEAVRERYNLAWAALLSGKLAAVAAIEATTGDSTVPSATDFWEENPDYGLVPRNLTDDPLGNPNPSLDPSVYRGMAF